MTITSTEKSGTPVVAINDIGSAEDFLAAVDAAPAVCSVIRPAAFRVTGQTAPR